MTFLLEITKAVLVWPSVALIALVVLVVKMRRLSFKDFADIVSRLTRIAISPKGIEVEFVSSVPTGEQLLEEVPYARSDRSLPPSEPPVYSPPKRRLNFDKS